MGDGTLSTVRDAVRPALAGLYSRSAALAAFHRLYWDLRLGLGPDTRVATVADLHAEFGVASRSEHVRVTRFGGERRLLANLLDTLDGDETVWDVGACIGTYACFAGKALPDGRVVAVEPEPLNHARLRSNLDRNLPEARWESHPTALFDSRTDLRLAAEFQEAGSGHHYLDDEAGIPVATTTGTALVDSGVPAPDVVKIDVQGAETQVIRGMAELLGGVELIYLEVHEQKLERYGSSTDRVEALLRDQGFELEHLGTPSTNRSGVYFLRATR